jgi:Tol biopolymer transport system component
LAFLEGADNPSGAEAGVWIMNADGTSREWICHRSRPRWSRDGDKIVFTSSHEGYSSVYVYDTKSDFSIRQSRIRPGPNSDMSDFGSALDSKLPIVTTVKF